MDTKLTEQELDFRDEVRAFLNEAWTGELRKQLETVEGVKPGMIEWQRRLYERWLARRQSPDK